MEVKEIVSYYIDDSSQTLDVTFRTISDSDDEIRNDQIEIHEVSELAYDFILNEIIEFDEDGEQDIDYLDELNIYEDDIISFLNEYYIIYPDRLPKSELF
jgi:hypothetical protein